MSDEEREPEHDFVLSLLIPLTSGELKRLHEGTRVVFRKVCPTDSSQVRAAAVYCATCQLPFERMTPTERTRCRGEVEEA